ncbi:MAG TPA: hypothetical protein QGG52_02160, partial [SAR86 cluster bacterium]|nr:hypothetical protein [SAR86 cluster bacterium]
MIFINNNLLFTPENINNSKKSGISILIKDQEFLTSVNSEILLFEEDDLKWSEMETDNKQFLGYLNERPCYILEVEHKSKIEDGLLFTPL